MRWLIVLFSITALLVSACGNFNLGKMNKPSIAVIDWQKAMEAHPKYEALKETQKDVEAIMKMREEQLVIGRRQIDLVNKLGQMKRTGQQNFMQAEFATKMAEKETVERGRLMEMEKAIDGEAEQAVASDRAAIEEAYRLPIVNLRLKIASIKMSESAKNELLKELQELLDKKDMDMEGVEIKKRNYINEKLAPEIERVRAAMTAYAKELQGSMMRKSLGIKGSDQEKMKQGPEELEKLIGSIDNQIDTKKREHDKILDDINSDITSALKKVTLKKKYDIVIKNVRANISGTDVTSNVCKELENLAN